jgi:membrane protease YdiL (CAAX protease family)
MPASSEQPEAASRPSILVRSFIQSHPLTTFFGASVGFGWLLTWLIAHLPSNPLILPLLAFPISYVPTLMAVIVLRVAGSDEERRAFRERLTTFRVGARWYVVALLLLPLIDLAGVALATVFGGRFPFHLTMLALLPLFLITNFGEEIGWRGYALPVLQTRFTPLASALLLGFVWGAFHWVAFLQNPAMGWAYLGVSTLYLMAVSVMMTAVFNQTRGSVVVMALMHAMFDTVSIGVTPLIETTVPLLAFALGVGVAWLLALGVVMLTGANLAGPSHHRARQQEPTQRSTGEQTNV